jgi:hypothetical protein
MEFSLVLVPLQLVLLSMEGSLVQPSQSTGQILPSFSLSSQLPSPLVHTRNDNAVAR